MNEIKLVYLTVPAGILLSSSAFANTSDFHSIEYYDLKEKYSTILSNYTNLLPKDKNLEKLHNIDEKIVKLEQYNSNIKSPYYTGEEDGYYYYFDDKQGVKDEFFLGGIYSGKNIRHNFKLTQWPLGKANNTHITGYLSSQGNIQLNPDMLDKEIKFSKNIHYLENSKVSKNALKSKLIASKSFSQNENSSSVSANGSNGTISVGASFEEKTLHDATSIEVKLVTNVYSLTLDNIKNLKASNTKNFNIDKFEQLLHPNNYPIYISSIDYGFAIIAKVDISNLSKDQQQNLNAKFGKGPITAETALQLKNSFKQERVNVTYEYRGITNSSAKSENLTIESLIEKLEKENTIYMNEFSKHPIKAQPIRASFKYLYPKTFDDEVNVNVVDINRLSNFNKYIAKPQDLEISATIQKGHLKGVQDGWGGYFGSHYDTTKVVLFEQDPNYAANKMDLELKEKFGEDQLKNNPFIGLFYMLKVLQKHLIHDDTWYFYREADKRSTGSKSKHYNLTINQPRVDETGNFHLFAHLDNENTSGAKARNSIEFQALLKSDQPINLKDIKRNKIHKVTFSKGDLEFDIKFNNDLDKKFLIN